LAGQQALAESCAGISNVVFAHKNLISSCIECGNNLPTGMACDGNSFEQRDRRDWLSQYVREGFDRCQADTQSGERSRPRGDCKSTDVALAESIFAKQCCNLRHELCGKCSPGKRNDLKDLAVPSGPALSQRNAAVLSGRVGGEKEHAKRFVRYLNCRSLDLALPREGGATCPRDDNNSDF